MTSSKNLYPLSRIDAREIWGHEALDFTPWLEQHIAELNEAIGFELEVTSREEPVGPFAVDLFGKDVSTGHPAIIENQLMPTDHGHLGQLLTYASGLGARTVVWISPQFREEHRQTLSWLNEITSEDLRFFGVEVEVLDIGGHRAAHFKLVAQPNSWQKTVALSTKPAPGATQKMLRYQEFFASLLGDLKSRMPSATTANKTQPQSWFWFSAGVTACWFAWSFRIDKRFVVELSVDLPDAERNRQIMAELQEHAGPLTELLEEPLEWDISQTRRSQRVSVAAPCPLTIDSPEEELQRVRPWAVKQMTKFVTHWRPLLQQIAR